MATTKNKWYIISIQKSTIVLLAEGKGSTLRSELKEQVKPTSKNDENSTWRVEVLHVSSPFDAMTNKQLRDHCGQSLMPENQKIWVLQVYTHQLDTVKEVSEFTTLGNEG